MSIIYDFVLYLRLFINSGHFLSFIYDYVQYLRNRVHYLRLFGPISRVASIGFFFYFFLLFLIYLNSKFHKVVNMRHFSTHPYSKRKNNWILKISFLESPCSILSSYILFFFFFDLIGLGLILIISVKLPQYCITLRGCWIQAQKFLSNFSLLFYNL